MEDINTGRMFTVMNEKPQSGSSLSPGSFEFMQNRRVNALDNKGMGEWLNEKDSLGNGIRVKTSYYVQFYNKTGTDQSLQRIIQQKTDLPQQVFYTFVNTTNSTINSYSDTRLDLEHFLEDGQTSGLNGTARIVTIPKAKNNLFVRLENIADLYDSDAVNKTLNLTNIMLHTWQSANMLNNVTAPTADQIKITEMSMTGNMELQEMLSRKVKWITKDDDKEDFVKSNISYDDDFTMINLEPQRIRTFNVTFDLGSTLEETPTSQFLQQ